jgi:hypothetical protein
MKQPIGLDGERHNEQPETTSSKDFGRREDFDKEELLIVQGIDEKGDFVYRTERNELFADAGNREDSPCGTDQLKFRDLTVNLEELDEELESAEEKLIKLKEELKGLKRNSRHFQEAIQAVPKE